MMGGSVVEIICIIVGGLSFILHMHRLRWFKKNIKSRLNEECYVYVSKDKGG